MRAIYFGYLSVIAFLVIEYVETVASNGWVENVATVFHERNRSNRREKLAMLEFLALVILTFNLSLVPSDLWIVVVEIAISASIAFS